MKKRIKSIIIFVLIVCMIFSFAVNAYAKSTADRIKYIVRSQLLFDDLAKFIEVVDAGDGAKIFLMILEIYPDLVALAKKSNDDDNSENNDANNEQPVNVIENEESENSIGLTEAAIISDGSIITLSGAIVISGAFIAAAIIFVNKKKTAAAVSATKNEPETSEERS